MEDELTSSLPLGKVWQGHEAFKAYKSGKLLSNVRGHSLRVCFRHLVEEDEHNSESNGILNSQGPSRKQTKKSVWVAWIDDQGKIYPFRKLRPVVKSTVDGKTPTESDHIEKTFVGHAFLFAVRQVDDDDDEEMNGNDEWQVDSIDKVTVIGGYRPSILSKQLDILEDDYPCHILEISEKKIPSFLRCSCHPPHAARSFTNEFSLVLREGNCLETLDTTGKEYEQQNIARWPVCVEKDCFANNRTLREIIRQDLEYAISCLPGHAQKALKESQTRIFINKSFQYGPKIRPIKAKGLCFHPSRNWLVKHGYAADKAQCVELYDTADYLKDRVLWGRGGIFIHELSHAYHNKCLPGGYANHEIMACWEQAMDEGLYNQVKVHGPQGPTARAYACENAMEYFAELSTAFLGGKKAGEEYNKWYPFNRAEIKAHDPRAFELLCKLWKVRP